MSIVTTVQFRGIESSPALEATIREHAERLEKFAADVRTCRVVVTRDSARHQQGSLYQISISLRAGRRVINVGVEGSQDARHADAYVAVTDAFDAVRRRLEDFSRRRRGDVKRHRAAGPNPAA